MFDSLTDRLQKVFKELGRRGKLREADVDEALREIRLALLEADVHYTVVKDLLAQVRQRAIGADIPAGLNPAQEVIRIMHEELTTVLGSPGRLELSGSKPRSIMLVGLQGSGKTTTAAKLAQWLRSKGERVLMVAADVRRPAAIEQLEILGDRISVPVHSEPDQKTTSVAEAGRQAADRGGYGVALFDTAGRSQIDDDMMSEVQQIHRQVEPVETLLVADAMTGQEAVRIAQGFKEKIPITGLILTKMDGDARGGAAISMRSVTGVPIKYIGTGEGLEALENFEPDRLASRILGMGDVASLIEKAEASLDAKTAERQVERLQSGEFSLEDFATQLRQVQQLGPLGKVLDMLPGQLTGGMSQQVNPAQMEQQLSRTQAILNSMTREERDNPKILNGSRKRRIAAGSGTTVQEINQLLRQFRQMKKLFKQLGKRGMGGLMPNIR
jgi:signal recognition particle subunit SRP54